ncbi:MAG: hypothetical protein IJH39_04430 [Clostridia bacterium]|nr:hypothetical protein [Clostridia bacterium]
MTVIILIILATIIIYWVNEYMNIDVYNTIYIGPNDEQVVVIHKTLFTVTLSYIAEDPETILLIDFITRYHK